MYAPSDNRASVERWFVKRGVPHLIADYTAAEDIFTRMYRFLLIVMFIELFLTFTDELVGLQQAALFTFGLFVLLGALALVNRIRGRRWNQIPDHVGVWELAVFVLVPPALRAVTTLAAVDFIQWLFINLVILGVSYLITSYGLFPMFPWALRQVWHQLVDIVNLFAKSLPLLLLFSAFLFVNAEIWQVSSDIPLVFFVGVVGFIISIGLAFLLLGLRHQLEDLNSFDSWSEVAALCEDSPLEARSILDSPGRPDPRPLRRGERFNLGLLMLVAQAIQISLVATMVGGFYIVFGLFTVGEETILQWTTLTEDAFDPLFDISVLGHPVVVTQSLLVVSGFIAAFSGLQFAVSLVTDQTYRDEFTSELRLELRELLAVRCCIENEDVTRSLPRRPTGADRPTRRPGDRRSAPGVD